MSDTPRVFVITPPGPGRSLAPARDFGIVHTIFSNHQHQSSLSPDESVYRATKVLLEEDYDPEVDYLLYAGGDPVGAMCLTLAARTIFPSDSVFKTLRWERPVNSDQGMYLPVEINLSKTDEILCN